MSQQQPRERNKKGEREREYLRSAEKNGENEKEANIYRERRGASPRCHHSTYMGLRGPRNSYLAAKEIGSSLRLSNLTGLNPDRNQRLRKNLTKPKPVWLDLIEPCDRAKYLTMPRDAQSGNLSLRRPVCPFKPLTF